MPVRVRETRPADESLSFSLPTRARARCTAAGEGGVCATAAWRHKAMSGPTVTSNVLPVSRQ